MTRKVVILLGVVLFSLAALFWFYESKEKFQKTEETSERSTVKTPSNQTAGTENGTSPSVPARDDSKVIPKGEFPDTETGHRLEKHLSAMDGMGENAEQIYQDSLAELKKEPEENIQILSQVYQKMGEGRYADRWKLVNTISAIQDNAGFEPLNSIAKQAIPPEKFPGSHGIGSTGEERVIRVTATDGLAALARNGNKDAEAALLQLAVEKDDISIRRRAIRGYLAAGDNYDERVQVLRTQIPPGYHSLITLEVTSPDAAAVPEPNPDEISILNPMRIENKLQSFLGWVQSRMMPSAWAIHCDYDPLTPEEIAAKGGEHVDLQALYESHYSARAWCDNKKMEKMWNDFKLEKTIWDGNTGFNEPCSLDFPLGRTFNTLWLLLTSAPDPAAGIDDGKLSVLRWGYSYAAQVTSHLRLACDQTGPPGALAWYGSADGNMNLSWGWAMGVDIVPRAGTIIHEAGHYWKRHDPEGTCRRGASCDPNWEYNAANTYEVLWYWRFYLYAVNTTSAHKDRAKVMAQDVLDTGFNEPPGYTIY